MPNLLMETQHHLGREEAARRLKEKFSVVHATYSSRVNNLQENWTDHTFSFSFDTMGMGVSGTVIVEDASVRLDVELPFAAILFKGAIEQRIRQEISDLLERD
ncbi:MAG TPA: polyhydroxyalkanoic acid system family protein [Thermoguttaceae bacterium]